jgi:hypothetical protein
VAVYKRGDRWHYRFQVGGRPFSGSAGAGASRAAAVQLEAQRRAQIAAESGGAAKHSVDDALAERIRLFQFRDIRPKAASELPVEHASRLLGHSEKEITERVYRRIGEVVKPTK